MSDDIAFHTATLCPFGHIGYLYYNDN